MEHTEWGVVSEASMPPYIDVNQLEVLDYCRRQICADYVWNQGIPHFIWAPYTAGVNYASSFHPPFNNVIRELLKKRSLPILETPHVWSGITT